MKNSLIHSKISLCVVFIFCISFIACEAQHHISSKDVVKTNTEDSLSSNLNENILFYINQYREDKGLPALISDTMVSKVALRHSINMANKKVAFGHEGFDERMDFIIKKIPDIKASAENVAEGKLSAEEVVKGWINSPHHKKNIEGNYALTGIGVAKDKKGTSYFTQIFIRE